VLDARTANQQAGKHAVSAHKVQRKLDTVQVCKHMNDYERLGGRQAAHVRADDGVVSLADGVLDDATPPVEVAHQRALVLNRGAHLHSASVR
jgi:hypothetical protein